MNIKNNWKLKYGIIFLIATIIIYGAFILFYGDSHEVVHYIWLHLGFIPLDLLLLTLILDEVLSKKEKEALHEKLDLIVGSFFSEMGNELISLLSDIDENEIPSLKFIKDWDLEDFDKSLKYLKDNTFKIKINMSEEEKIIFLSNLREFLMGEREFLVSLINNATLLEKEEFSELILATFHLCEELELRDDLSQVSKVDFIHLVGDMNRVYNCLIYEWVRYLKHLKKHHPYMISLSIRTNPFDKESSIYVVDDENNY
ncbi:MAG: hypothetical protein Q4P14_06340 [Methanobacteriaceae archaeon]|nr:hypothetical protein [Methanobacteriaceae archaeon]